MRTLVAHRRDLVQDQTRRITRLRALLVEVFPGLETTLDFDRKSALLAVTKVATPAAARRLGEARLARWLEARGVRKAAQLARCVLDAAKEQRRELPAAGTKAALAAEIASEILRSRGRLAELEERLEGLVASRARRGGSSGRCRAWERCSQPSSWPRPGLTCCASGRPTG